MRALVENDSDKEAEDVIFFVIQEMLDEIMREVERDRKKEQKIIEGKKV